MKYVFKFGGKDIAVATIDNVVAVRPTQDLRAAMTTSKLTARFGRKPADDTQGGKASFVLPSRNRKLFEQAGWVFVESTAMADAAASRRGVEGADSVRRVYLGRGGTLIGTDRLAVQFEPDVKESAIRSYLAKDNLTLVRQLRFAPNLCEVRIRTHRPELDVVQELQADDNPYLFVEPVFLEAIPGRQHAPNDPDFNNQWFHENDGANGGALGADIQSRHAWDIARGAGVRIAVVDNGMQVDHPDLSAGIVGGGYFVSDGNGGATFQRWRPGRPGFPDRSHGTTCLGMAGARMDNNSGGCGSAPESALLAIACLEDQVGSQLTLARAIAYAADPTTEDPRAQPDDGAHVISCSLGPNGADWEMSTQLQLAIDGAVQNGRQGDGVPLGVPLFWAATNGAFDIQFDEVCSHDNVIAVSRSNRTDSQDGAGFGTKLEFLAPGTDVYNTISGGGYDYVTGCSLAAPLAAGVAALILEKYPHWTATQVRERLQQSCDKIGGVTYGPDGKHVDYGFGRINALSAVQ